MRECFLRCCARSCCQQLSSVLLGLRDGAGKSPTKDFGDSSGRQASAKVFFGWALPQHVVLLLASWGQGWDRDRAPLRPWELLVMSQNSSGLYGTCPFSTSLPGGLGAG